MNTFKKIALLAAPLLVIGSAYASGPLALCDDGVPYLWPNGGQNITWNPDQGNLGALTKTDADNFVATSFNAWQNVPSATISYVKGADLPVNVDETNFVDYLEAPAPDGLSAIVYDDTGAIFELLFGADSGVLGFAGPEFGDPATCTILEGYSFLNGPEFSPADPNTGLSIMVHEFGHFSNLAHAQTNGGVLLGIALGTPEPSGPAPNNTFGTPTVADFANNGLLETMYPFFFGPQFGEQVPGIDDIASISRLYPAPGYLATTATISGSIFAPNGSTRLSGINIIARNVANPFLDAVSGLSGETSIETDPAASALVGTYKFTGLTPGAQYVVYVDGILDGGFSTEPRNLPGPEEFYSATETNADPPGVSTPVTIAAGATRSGVNVIFNVPQPGDPLAVGDDDFVELFPPFPIDFCGERFSSLFVNANGSVTFGRADGTFAESTFNHLSGPPRIAGLWDDLNSTAGGTVTFNQTANTFTVSWQGVPEFPAVGANTFSIKIDKKNLFGEFLGPVVGNPFSITYGAVSAKDGLAGYSCGGAMTSGYEEESDLSAIRGPIGAGIPMPAVFEDLVGTGTGETFDLHGTLRFSGVNKIIDLTEFVVRNDKLRKATPLFHLPFDSANPAFATVIDDDRDDVDYYSFRVKAGDIIAVEVVRGDLDSVIGIFDADTGNLLITDDDGGNGLLSRLVVQANTDLRLAVAVSTYPDLTFIGGGDTNGRYSLYVNTYRGTPVALGDDDTVQVPLARPFSFAGAPRNSVFVNSNGSLSFGAGDPDFDANVPAFLAGPPRISPLWTDLDPTGFLGNEGFVVVDANARPAAVHYISVSEFFSSDPNYFTTELRDFGGITMKWGPTARSSALVGVTQGGGAADPGPTNLSKRGLRPVGTTYENFLFNVSTKGVSDFDLFFNEIRNK